MKTTMRIAAVALTAALAGACGGGGDGATEEEGSKGSDLSRALCSDLDGGRTLMQIAPSDMDPEKFAGHVYVATRDVCPKHAKRKDVATFLKQWGF